MNITIETKSYNERRMGKPWIAKVDFTDPKGVFAFGDWAGDSRNGGEGVLSIAANTGDIIATGQKDNRQPRNSAASFFVVNASGELDDLGDKGAAYKHYLAAKLATPDRAALENRKGRTAYQVGRNRGVAQQMTNPKGAGRKPGSTKDREKLGTSISRVNAEWLRAQKARGFPIAATLDRLIDEARKEG